MQPFFVTASGTNVGKTHVMSTLCWQLREAGKQVTALKPVISGYDPEDTYNDAAMILRSCGLEPTDALTKSISKWRYKAPLAPNMAANSDQIKQLDMQELVAYCKEHETVSSDVLMVEGVGGILVPLNDEYTVADWMHELDWPAILVVGSYLGTISHTLSAIEVLQKRNIPVRALVVNQSPNIDIPLEDTVATFEKFVDDDIPIVKMPRVEKHEPWKHMPLITWMVE